MPASSRSREARPGLSQSVRSLRQEPQWSAGRRARPDFWRASAPAHRRVATLLCVGAGPMNLRLSALRLPLYEPEANLKELRCRCGGRQTSGAQRVARTRFYFVIARSGATPSFERLCPVVMNEPKYPAAVDPPRAFVSRRATFVGMIFSGNRHPHRIKSGASFFGIMS